MTASPKVFLASDVGIFMASETGNGCPAGWASKTPAEKGDANADAWNTWATSNSYANSWLLFDIPGGYYLDPDRCYMRPNAGVRGVPGVQLWPSADGDYLIYCGGGGTRWIQDLFFKNLDGKALDYFVEHSGTWPNPSNPGLLRMERCTFWGATEAAFHGGGSTFVLRDCVTYGGKLGMHSEGCSESVVDTCSFQSFTEHGLLAEGSFSGTNNRKGRTQPNGGRLTIRDTVCSPSNVDGSFKFNGCAALFGSQLSVEGTGTGKSSYLFQNSVGCALSMVRSGSGNLAHFDNSYGCTIVQGKGNIAGKIRYTNNSKACMAICHAESSINPTRLEQVWDDGTNTWSGFIKSEGVFISQNGTKPTAGWFNAGDRIVNYNPGVGDPYWWQCASAGYAGVVPTGQSAATFIDGPTR